MRTNRKELQIPTKDLELFRSCGRILGTDLATTIRLLARLGAIELLLSLKAKGALREARKYEQILQQILGAD